MVPLTNLAITLTALCGLFLIYALRHFILARKTVRPREKEIRERIIQLQLALCDVSTVVSSVERDLQNTFRADSVEMIQSVLRARSIITALHRRIEQANALLNNKSIAGLQAAEELLMRNLSTKLDCFDSLIEEHDGDTEIEPSKWLAELRKIRRELSLVALPKVA